MNKRAHLRPMLTAIAPLLLGLGALVSSPTLNATHAWGSYHWERSSNPVSLGLGDNLTNDWPTYLDNAQTDWNSSNYLSVSIVPGAAGNLRRCSPSTGRIEICNNAYGFNGWLGLASIYVDGDHIVAAYVKLNDTYHDSSPYNLPTWKQFVMCQEVGHVFGLDHQDIDFYNANLGSCMDYTSDPSTNTHPNAHDFDELELIYSHLDTADAGGSTGGSGGPGCKGGPKKCGAIGPWKLPELDLDGPGQWGRLISEHGPQETFELDFGQGHKIITYVTWTLEEARGDHSDH